MPRPSYPLADYLIHGLKWMMEDYCCFRLYNKQDCEQLSGLISYKTQTSVSSNTLYRIFLHPNNTNKPYLHTLNVLAQFIDFKNWDDFCEYYQELYDFQFLSGKIADQKEYKSLLRLNIYNREFKSLYPFFEQFTNDLSYHKKHLLGEEIYNTLRFNPSSNIPFFQKFHHVSMVRETFFEYLADPDFNIPQYEFGLKCYLKSVNPDNSPKDLQDFLFANSLIFRNAILTSQRKNAYIYGRRLYQRHVYSADELNEIHIFPKFRYLAYFLLYRNLSVGFDHTYWEWFYEYMLIFLQKSTLIERRIIIHTCYDALSFHPKIQQTFLADMLQKFPKNFEHFPINPDLLPPSKVLKLLDTNAATFYQGQRIFRASKL